MNASRHTSFQLFRFLFSIYFGRAYQFDEFCVFFLPISISIKFSNLQYLFLSANYLAIRPIQINRKYF